MEGSGKRAAVGIVRESTSYQGRFVVAIYPMERGSKSA